ncbi:MAG: M15 family metallopeptidase [Clostridia bacterium]|nr:M15 family metallopeptidase [Clostridia bacterium]
MADERQNDREYDDLLADFHIAQARKTAGQSQRPAPAAPPQATRRNAGDIPRKTDGTPCTPEELRQLQAYRQAMQNRQRTAPPQTKQNTITGRQPAGQGEKARQTAAYEAAYRQQNTGSQGQKKPVYRHRKPNRPNGAVLLFAVLVLTVAGFSIGQIVQNRSETPPDTETTPIAAGETADMAENLPSQEKAEEEPAGEDLVLWNTEVIDNALLDTGDLILVNYAYPYDDADTIAVKDVYGNKNKYYQVANTGITLTQTALDAMNAMTEAFYKETGSNDMMIVSGYRNVQSQRDIYNDRVVTQGEEMAALYVASPGYSEHHTGLAMDLSFYTDDGTSVSIENYEHGSWIDENCADFGFVLRYPSDKVDITKIGYEFWHYRYVGHPHADIMMTKHLCLEEYLDYIKQYTTDTKLLWIQPGGLVTEVSASALPSEGTLLYYVPMAEGDTTEIRIPRGNLFADTKISGNNMDGFIVTVQIGTTQP